MHAAREEAQGMQAPAAGFVMRPTRLLVALLRPLQDDADLFEVSHAVDFIKPQRADQSVGGVAHLAQRDRRIFPPAAAGSGGPGTND